MSVVHKRSNIGINKLLMDVGPLAEQPIEGFATPVTDTSTISVSDSTLTGVVLILCRIPYS